MSHNAGNQSRRKCERGKSFLLFRLQSERLLLGTSKPLPAKMETVWQLLPFGCGPSISLCMPLYSQLEPPRLTTSLDWAASASEWAQLVPIGSLWKAVESEPHKISESLPKFCSHSYTLAFLFPRRTCFLPAKRIPVPCRTNTDPKDVKLEKQRGRAKENGTRIEKGSGTGGGRGRRRASFLQPEKRSCRN